MNTCNDGGVKVGCDFTEISLYTLTIFLHVDLNAQALSYIL